MRDSQRCARGRRLTAVSTLTEERTRRQRRLLRMVWLAIAAAVADDRAEARRLADHRVGRSARRRGRVLRQPGRRDRRADRRALGRAAGRRGPRLRARQGRLPLGRRRGHDDPRRRRHDRGLCGHSVVQPDPARDRRSRSGDHRRRHGDQSCGRTADAEGRPRGVLVDRRIRRSPPDDRRLDLGRRDRRSRAGRDHGHRTTRPDHRPDRRRQHPRHRRAAWCAVRSRDCSTAHSSRRRSRGSRTCSTSTAPGASPSTRCARAALRTAPSFRCTCWCPATGRSSSGHDTVEQIEHDLRELFDTVTVFTHLEPIEDPVSFAGHAAGSGGLWISDYWPSRTARPTARTTARCFRSWKTTALLPPSSTTSK